MENSWDKIQPEAEIPLKILGMDHNWGVACMDPGQQDPV